MSARPAVGARGAPSSPWRSTSSTERSSCSSSLLACLMAASAGRACSGCSSRRWRATLAWTLTREMLWASTSWSSRAMRSRSSLARSAPGLLLAAAPSFDGPLPAGASRLSDGEQHEQPGREGDALPDARCRAGPDQRREPQEREVAAPDDDPGQGSPGSAYGGEEGHDQRDEDRPVRVAEEGVGQRRGEDDQQHCAWSPAATHQRQCPADDQQVGDRVEHPMAGMPLGGEVGVDQLDGSDAQGEGQVVLPGPASSAVEA